MSLAKLSFFLTEALTNLRRSGITTFITVSTVAISLVIMGAFLFTTMNLEAFLLQMQSEAMVTVYLKNDTLLAEAHTFNMRLADMPEVADSLVVSSETLSENFSLTLMIKDFFKLELLPKIILCLQQSELN
jgi:cell division transport system permease protein